jgi:hypothetical protein
VRGLFIWSQTGKNSAKPSRIADTTGIGIPYLKHQRLRAWQARTWRSFFRTSLPTSGFAIAVLRWQEQSCHAVVTVFSGIADEQAGKLPEAQHTAKRKAPRALRRGAFLCRNGYRKGYPALN